MQALAFLTALGCSALAEGETVNLEEGYCGFAETGEEENARYPLNFSCDGGPCLVAMDMSRFREDCLATLDGEGPWRYTNIDMSEGWFADLDCSADKAVSPQEYRDLDVLQWEDKIDVEVQPGENTEVPGTFQIEFLDNEEASFVVSVDSPAFLGKLKMEAFSVEIQREDFMVERCYPGNSDSGDTAEPEETCEMVYEEPDLETACAAMMLN